jgi:hypothetical protein
LFAHRRAISRPSAGPGRRERVNAAIGAALETLARVPDLLALGGT